MSRRTPPWRYSCLFITGALALTGCTDGSVPEEAPTLEQQARALLPGPDLRITELSAPDNAEPGQPITVTAKVCNAGDQNVYSNTTLQVYLSTTSTQQVPGPGTPPLTVQSTQGQTDVGPVYAGQCVSRSLSISVSPPSGFTGNGAYYLGASIDTQKGVSESDETNNGFVRGLMGVGWRPDLVVTRVDAPANLAPGQYVTASATVCNVGTDPSPSGSVQLYLSTVNGLTVPPPSGPPPTTQVLIGAASVSSLNEGQCRTVPVSGTVLPPPTSVPPGTPLYLGAIADAPGSVLELREDNNTFVQGPVGVGNGPDLIIRSVTGPASVRPGDPLQATATVCNTGFQSANTVDVRVVLSSAPSLAAPSTQPRPMTELPVANFSVPYLGAGQCATRTVQGPANSPYGSPVDQPLYLGAIVDLPQGVLELREDNNTRADSRVGVGSRPDLTVVALEAPSLAPLYGPFTVSAKVCNVGTTRSAEVPVEVYVTNESSLNIAPSGPPPMTAVLMGMAQVPALEARECVTRRVTGSAGLPPGAVMPNPVLSVGAVVDPRAALPELREDNNVSALSRIGLGSGPDLVVRTLTAPSSVKIGTSLWTDVQVCNEGTLSTGPSTVGLFLSTTPTAVPPTLAPSPLSQAPVGTVEVSPLAAGACALYPKTVSVIPPPEATPSQPLYLVALADVNQQSMEPREDNNLRAAGPITPGNGPDLVVTDVTGPSTASPYGPVTLNVTVCNVGTEPAGPAQVMGVLSTEEALSTQSPPPAPSETVVNVAPVPGLAVGQCVTTPLSGPASLPYYADPSSPLFLGARVDSANQVMELREDNNARVTSRLILGNGPDLVVRSVTAPTGLPQYSSFSAQVQVCNEGNQPLYGSVPLDLVISTETSLYVPGQGLPPYTQVQSPVGNVMVSALASGQCTTLPVQGFVVRPSSALSGQPLYLGALVDAPGSLLELREDNNALTMATPISQAQ
ncbi:CARDB domain-containing protein [Corallococcus coralloides]|uniref:CARDB domain-containing protein n=1 Tax=Corallococcus coralloides TaxID=184914 RepID=UPI00384F96BC